eukprot:s165_g38.t1
MQKGHTVQSKLASAGAVYCLRRNRDTQLVHTSIHSHSPAASLKWLAGQTPEGGRSLRTVTATPSAWTPKERRRMGVPKNLNPVL